MLLACSSNRDKEIINNWDTYFENHTIKVFVLGTAKEKEKIISDLYERIDENDYVKFIYYYLRTKFGVEHNQLEQALNYSDTAQIIYAGAPHYIKTQLRSKYLDFLLHRGNILFAQKKYVLGYDTFFEILQILDKYPVYDLENIVYHNMGMNSYKQKVYDKAAEYFKEELKSIDRTKKEHLPAYLRFFRRQEALSNIALSYTKYGMNDSAKIYYKAALKYLDNNFKGNCNIDQYHACKAVVLGNFAKVYRNLGLIDSAIAYYNKSIQLTLYQPLTFENSSRDVKDAGLSLIQLADIYRIKGDIENYKKTVEELNKWYDDDINYVFNHDEYRLGYLRQNALYNKYIGNNDRALNYLLQYSSARDSIDVLEQISKEKNLSVALEIKMREEEVKNLKLANKVNQIYVWSAVIIAFLLALVAFVMYRSGQKSKKNNLLLLTLNDEIKLQQQETQKAYNQAVKANKEKDKLLHIIVHDLRNPLSGISTLSDIILEGNEQTDVKKIVEVISNASKRSISMVNELLLSSTDTSDKINFVQVSLNKVGQEVVELFKYKAIEKDITLELHLSSPDVIVLGDSTKLMRVVSNLLHNAIKFSNEHKKILIEIDCKDGKGIFTIQDQGIGMGEIMQHNLKNGATTTVRDGTAGEKSYGSGWKICQQIIRAHKGQLHISSTENVGTSVRFELATAIV